MKNNNLLKKMINNKILDDVYLGREDIILQIHQLHQIQLLLSLWEQ